MTEGAFSLMLEEAFGRERADVILRSLDEEASTSIRLNPLKVKSEPEVSQDNSIEVPWCSEGRILSERPSFTMDPAFHSGAYYVQDSSSMFVGHIFRRLLENQKGRLRVLDLCAAPGGKTTDMASSLREHCGDDFLLVSNEVMSNRCGILADNVARWGDPNVIVTSADPAAFASLGEFFDIILTDVPCSGEGMFRKDEDAVRQWSADTVGLCCARQKRILADVWPALRRGGRLIYSTCTFEDAENDAVMEWTADELGGTVHEYDYSSLEGVIPTKTGGLLVPGFVKGEGQFVSALIKNTGVDGFRLSGKPAVGTAEKRKGNLLIHIPGSIVREVAALEPLRPIQTGVAKGELKGRDLVPSADWALSLALPDGAYPVADLDRETALRFLHRDSIFLKDAPKGFVLVRFEGHPLGFVKNLGSRCNNLHPQGRKIKMDV